METVFIILGVTTFGAVLGGVIWFFYHLEKKRTESLKAAAAEIDLEFLETNDALLEKMHVFSLFNKGRGRKMKNVMQVETDIARLSIFDYQYTTGGGQHSQTHRHTVVSMESDSLSLPSFSLRPEGFFQKIGAAIGMKDIDFESHPEFSRIFVLKGDDEPSIRHFFDGEILELFEKRKGICVESVPSVFIYLYGGRKKPEQIREFMNEAFAIYTAFFERASRTQLPPI